MIKKLTIFLTSLLMLFATCTAKEGMWLPLLLQKLNENDMQSMGLKLTAADIYSVNHSSLKDAIVSFGGFCTAELISDKGLLLTNHHCGYSQIQYHSSVQHDYLSDGYWAKDYSEELRSPNLTATFIVRMEDVTAAVLDSVDVELTAIQRENKIKKNINKISQEAIKGTNYQAVIKPFYYGNQYYLFITKTYKDIRLVGAPPSAIGKFGGDTDNWMWPRHTGDFSLFRIYADKNNEPAEPSDQNVPYHPIKSLKISTKGYHKDDFTMVYGFPGKTEEYLSSYAVNMIRNVENPAKISIRKDILDVMDRHMRQDDEVRIKYAAKYAGVSNYWKKWEGEDRGLDRFNAIEVKKAEEKKFIEAAQRRSDEKYLKILPSLQKLYTELNECALARDYFIEIAYRGLDIVRISRLFRKDITDLSAGKEFDEEHIEKLRTAVKLFYKDYDLSLDKELFQTLMEKYRKDAPTAYLPSIFKTIHFKYRGHINKYADHLYKHSIFTQQSTVLDLLNNYNKKAARILLKDPAYKLSDNLWSNYLNEISPNYRNINARINELNKLYIKAMQELIPKNYYPDANGSLRLAYGKVEGYTPEDAVEYNYYTTAKGILEKYATQNEDYQLPKRMVDLIQAKDFGNYAENGELHICFIASNHTTGGNSGSPVLNAEGELVGLNFDRNWEGTMSDIMYDPNQCRNIAVDVRYILWVIDKYAGANRLIKEMKL